MDLFARRTVVCAAPSGRRSRVAQPMTAAAASGQFELQECGVCATVQYPPREACCRCLSDELVWKHQSGAGELLSRTALHHSHDPYFRSRVPWHVGLVRLDSGVSILAHLPADAPKPPARVWVKAHLDRKGAGVLVAFGRSDGAGLTEDPRLQEMCSDPGNANVFVTDGGSLHSQAVVRALAAAGAARIWVGFESAGDSFVVPQGLCDLPRVTCLRMDVTDEPCVGAVAASIGGEIDILINTAAVAQSRGVDAARSEMEVHYFGLLNLARHFVSPLSERAVRTRRLCPAWVNVLCVSGLPGYPSWGTYGASMAAARSLSECLRVQLREAGVRVVDVYPGPLDDRRSEQHQVPKLGAPAFAQSIVEGLRAGVEEVFPGEVAQEWFHGDRGRQL